MDRLQAMGAFLAVVDGSGFAPAARKLNLSPSAVTRAVAELEAGLGARLLTRTTRVVRVTEIGARYAEDCRRILAAVAEADAGTAGAQATPRGHLVVTAPALFGAIVVTPIVTAYLGRYPEVDASCWFLDPVVNLVEEGVDVAVRIGELPDYLARQGSPSSPDDLAAHTIISAISISSAPEWRLRMPDGLRSVKVRPRLTSTSNDAAIRAVLAGFGLARLLSYQVAEHLEQGRLVRVLIDNEPAPLPVHLVHREGRHETAKVRAFLDSASAALQAHAWLR